jgi:hypothetical protein
MARRPDPGAGYRQFQNGRREQFDAAPSAAPLGGDPRKAPGAAPEWSPRIPVGRRLRNVLCRLVEPLEHPVLCSRVVGTSRVFVIRHQARLERRGSAKSEWMVASALIERA